MKFEISRTSDYSSTTAPCEGTIVEHASYEKWGLKDYTYHTKEFNTLEELMDFIQNVANGKVVINDIEKNEEMLMSENYACPECNFSIRNGPKLSAFCKRTGK